MVFLVSSCSMGCSLGWRGSNSRVYHWYTIGFTIETWGYWQLLENKPIFLAARGNILSFQVAVCQNLVPLVNIKIAGKWMFIPLKMVLIGIDPYPGQNPQVTALCCIRSISFCILRCLGRTPTPSWDKCMATEGFCLGMSGPTFECLGDAPLNCIVCMYIY